MHVLSELCTGPTNKARTCFRSSFLLAISAAFSSLLRPAKLIVGVTGVTDLLISESAFTQLFSPHPSGSVGGGEEIGVGIEAEPVDAARALVTGAGPSFLGCLGRERGGELGTEPHGLSADPVSSAAAFTTAEAR